MTRKYNPLQEFLITCDQPRISLSFAEIERIIGAKLPDSARENQAWWANDGRGHSQVWLGEGWKIGNLNIAGEKVAFYRVDPPATGGDGDSKPIPSPYGSLSGTVTILDPDALTAPIGESWEA